MKILTVVGARPQFIKASTVSRALRSQSEIHEILVHTGQHYDYGMSDVFFNELDIPLPHYNLGIGSGQHGQQTGQMLIGIEEILCKESPDLVLVYGDTNSTLAGSLAAAKLHIPVAHIEAGLRSFNRLMPEEINRVLTDHVSEYLFAPTATAVQNLQQEGISLDKTFLVGDVMYDVALHFLEKAKQHSHILEILDLESQEYCLATIHRAENTDDGLRMKRIFESLIRLSKKCPVVLPIHPRTRKALKRIDYFEEVEQAIQLIEPVGYLDMIRLEKHSRMILTDSGGIQKESYFFEIPCVVLRDETEWIELLETNWHILASPNDQERLNALIESHLNLDKSTLDHPSLYGEGKAAYEVLGVLLSI